jgi:hypothetical protein
MPQGATAPFQRRGRSPTRRVPDFFVSDGSRHETRKARDMSVERTRRRSKSRVAMARARSKSRMRVDRGSDSDEVSEFQLCLNIQLSHFIFSLPSKQLYHYL